MSNIFKKLGDNGSSIKSFFLEDIIKDKFVRRGIGKKIPFQKADFFGENPKLNQDLMTDTLDLEIDRVLEKARERAKSIEEEAYSKGFSEGEKKGLEEGRKKTVVLEKLLEELSTYREKQYRDIEKELVDLVTVISKKIINQELTVNKEAVLNIVKAAIESAVGNEEIKIRINPEDYDNVSQHREEFIHSIDGLKNISFEADKSVLQGGCLIETIYGDIDARLDKQLETVAENLRASFKEEE